MGDGPREDLRRQDLTSAVRLTSAAARDVALAQEWYLDETPYMLQSLEEELDATFGRISDRPSLYQTVAPTLRRAPVRKFPFSVFYRVLPRWIEVIAILHQARDPRTWRQRH